MVKTRRQKSMFVAQDEDGKNYRIAVIVDVLDAGHLEDPDAEIEGMPRLLTPIGQRVNYLSHGKYLLVESRRVLTSADPSAP